MQMPCSQALEILYGFYALPLFFLQASQGFRNGAWLVVEVT